MAQNYNLNSSFGLNVTGGSKAPAQNQPLESTNRSNDLFESNIGSSNRYESVFSGDVEKEINMYSRQMMIVGMNLKAADKNIRKFDMNI